MFEVCITSFLLMKHGFSIGNEAGAKPAMNLQVSTYIRILIEKI